LIRYGFSEWLSNYPWAPSYKPDAYDNYTYANLPIFVRCAFDDTGDVILLLGEHTPYGLEVNACSRRSGNWTHWGVGPRSRSGRGEYGHIIVDIDAGGDDMFSWGSGQGGGYEVMGNKMSLSNFVTSTGLNGVTSCGGGGGGGWPRYKNMSVVYDKDWLVTQDWCSDNYMSGVEHNHGIYTILIDANQQAQSQLWYGIVGGGTYRNKWHFTMEAMIATVKLTSNDLMFTSVKDFQDVSSNITMVRAQGYAQGAGSAGEAQTGIPLRWYEDFIPGWGYNPKGTLSRDIANNTFGEAIAFSFLYKPAGHPVMLSTYDGKAVHFYRMREDTNIEDGTFLIGEKWINRLPLVLCGNSTYLFAYNANQLLISPQVGDWEKPTIGTGAGDSFDIDTSRIIRLNETVNAGQQASLDIVLNNYDGYYDTPGTSAVDHLKIGSRVNLSIGYEIGGVEHLQEYARYFVNDWGYTRNPNAAYFTLNCIDAWGLLDKYTFPVEMQFNQYEDATQYSLYQLIEMLIQSVGGTLTYITKSTDIDSIKPRIKVRTGDTAGNVLRRLLNLVPDQIKFFGNDGTIMYLQTTDTPVYNYKFPVEVS
jgi:hypothetical protein